jgi:hypothetical protein
LGGQDPRAYFIGYTITDTQGRRFPARMARSFLAVKGETAGCRCQFDGTTLDNTHKVGEQRMAAAARARDSGG